MVVKIIFLFLFFVLDVFGMNYYVYRTIYYKDPAICIYNMSTNSDGSTSWGSYYRNANSYSYDSDYGFTIWKFETDARTDFFCGVRDGILVKTINMRTHVTNENSFTAFNDIPDDYRSVYNPDTQSFDLVSESDGHVLEGETVFKVPDDYTGDYNISNGYLSEDDYSDYTGITYNDDGSYKKKISDDTYENYDANGNLLNTTTDYFLETGIGTIVVQPDGSYVDQFTATDGSVTISSTNPDGSQNDTEYYNADGYLTGTTTYNSDGSTTEYVKDIETGDISKAIHTATDGTVTTGYSDGSYDTTTFNLDGSYQTTHTSTDGTTTTTSYNSDGTEYDPNQNNTNVPLCDDGAPALKVGNDFICDRNCNDVGYYIGTDGQCYNPQICTDKSNECIDSCPNGVKSFSCTDSLVTSPCVCQDNTTDDNSNVDDTDTTDDNSDNANDNTTNNDDTTNNDNTDSQNNTNDNNSNVDDTDTTNNDDSSDITDDNSDNVNDDTTNNDDSSTNDTTDNTNYNTNNDYSSAPAGGSGTGGNSLSEDLKYLTNAINNLQNTSGGTSTTENTTVNFDDTNIVNAVNENKSILEDIKDGFTGVTDFLSDVTDLISNPSSIGDTINQYLVDSVDKYNEKFFNDTCQNIEEIKINYHGREVVFLSQDLIDNYFPIDLMKKFIIFMFAFSGVMVFFRGSN
jgi:hypothetical protein